MYDLENMDVMLGSYPGQNLEVQAENNKNEIDLESNKQDQELVHENGEYQVLFKHQSL